MTKAQRTEKTNQATELDRLLRTLRAARKKQREFEEEHEEVLAGAKEIQDTITGLIERVKIEARKVAKVGETKVIADDGELHVSVQGKEARKFNLAKVKKTLPASLLELVITEVVDGKAVDNLVENGKLDADIVDKIATFEPMTPAVTVRLP